MDSLYIEDGYTERGFITAIPGLRPQVEFAFRPAVPARRTGFAVMQQSGDEVKAERAIASLIRDHIVDWPGGIAVLKNDEKLKKMNPNVRTALIDRILGYERADDRDTDEAQAQAEQEKNSSKG